MGLDVEAALKVPLVYSNSNDDLALNYSLPDLIKLLSIYFEKNQFELFQKVLQQRGRYFFKEFLTEKVKEGSFRFCDRVFQTPRSCKFISDLLYYIGTFECFSEPNVNGKYAVQYVLESRDISNQFAFMVAAKNWVVFVLNQYKSYAGGRFFDQVFSHVENLFELHKKEMIKIFLAITENKTKKVTSFNEFFDMQRTADLPNGMLKANIFSIFIQFSDLETLDNKKYFCICKESPSVVIQLLIYARENLKEEFMEHFKKYSEDEAISRSLLNESSLEFADMACESSDEDITKFLIRHTKIQSKTKKLMLPTICKFGLHESLELCFSEFQYLITENHVFYFKHLLQTNYKNPQYTENIDKCLMVLEKHDDLITERDFVDFVLNEDHLKEVFQLVRIAQTSKVQYPVFTLLDDFFGMTYSNKTVLDDLDPNVLAAFLRSRINILAGNLISVNYSFLFDDFADYSNSIRSESLKPLKKIANTEHLQHLIQHPVLELFINESYWKFQIISLVHSGIYFLLLTMLFWGTYTQNFWFYFWLPLYVLFRELFQYNFSKDHHFASITNWFELLIIFCGSCGIIALLADNTEVFNMSSSVLVLLATTGLLLLMKNTNSSLFLNMSMFAQVNKSFLKTLVMFASILIAYSFVFHLLWTMHTPENTLQFSQFQVFPPLKVLMMLIGDFDTANVGIIHWDQFIFYGSFVCLAVPFINFISALAIGDVQNLRKDAKIFIRNEKLKTICSYETFCKNLETKEFLRKVLELFVNPFTYLNKLRSITVAPSFDHFCLKKPTFTEKTKGVLCACRKSKRTKEFENEYLKKIVTQKCILNEKIYNNLKKCALNVELNKLDPAKCINPRDVKKIVNDMQEKQANVLQEIINSSYNKMQKLQNQLQKTNKEKLDDFQYQIQNVYADKLKSQDVKIQELHAQIKELNEVNLKKQDEILSLLKRR